MRRSVPTEWTESMVKSDPLGNNSFIIFNGQFGNFSNQKAVNIINNIIITFPSDDEYKMILRNTMSSSSIPKCVNGISLRAEHKRNSRFYPTPTKYTTTPTLYVEMSAVWVWQV
jgi:hypothetical protein